MAWDYRICLRQNPGDGSPRLHDIWHRVHVRPVLLLPGNQPPSIQNGIRRDPDFSEMITEPNSREVLSVPIAEWKCHVSHFRGARTQPFPRKSERPPRDAETTVRNLQSMIRVLVTLVVVTDFLGLHDLVNRISVRRSTIPVPLEARVDHKAIAAAWRLSVGPD